MLIYFIYLILEALLSKCSIKTFHVPVQELGADIINFAYYSFHIKLNSARPHCFDTFFLNEFVSAPSLAQCMAMMFSYCQDVPYSHTTFPNIVGHRSRQDLETGAEYLLLSVIHGLLNG